MASEVYINIKDLPELSEVNNGDYIIVETSTGTHIVNFENFLIPTANSVITATVTQNASAFTDSVTDLSSAVNALSSNINDNSSNITELSTSYTTFKSSVSSISNTFIGQKQITVKAGDTSTSTVINIGTVYGTNNILLTPANKYAATEFFAYPENVDTNTNLITIRGYANVQTATLNSLLSTVTLSNAYTAVAAQDAIYNVFVIKT